MIASLTGTIQSVFQGSIIVEVGGVGYEVFLVERTLRSADIREGEQVFLFTHHHIRENSSELYGFLSYNEKQMFLSLLSVSGIGPKVALSILHTASVDVLVEAVSQQDHSILQTIAGIGQKKAQKIILELKDKIDDIEIAHIIGEARIIEKDVLDALENMGYSRAHIREAMREIPKDLQTLEQKIKATLQQLSQ